MIISATTGSAPVVSTRSTINRRPQYSESHRDADLELSVVRGRSHRAAVNHDVSVGFLALITNENQTELKNEHLNLKAPL